MDGGHDSNISIGARNNTLLPTHGTQQTWLPFVVRRLTHETHDQVAPERVSTSAAPSVVCGLLCRGCGLYASAAFLCRYPPTSAVGSTKKSVNKANFVNCVDLNVRSQSRSV